MMCYGTSVICPVDSLLKMANDTVLRGGYYGTCCNKLEVAETVHKQARYYSTFIFFFSQCDLRQRNLLRMIILKVQVLS